MIEAVASQSFARLAERLADRAKLLAEAEIERRKTPADPQRWRKARLLWPLFTRG